MGATTQAVVAILAAVGGVGGIVQVIKAIRAWRDGVRQREDQADERLVKRLERRIESLEVRADLDQEYIRRLVSALGQAGIAIPSRKDVADPPA